MPTIMTHAAVAAAMGVVIPPARRRPALFWILSAGLAMLPDADVLAWSFGIPWSSPWSHRGATHSVAFAALTGLVAARLAGSRLAGRFWPIAVYCFAVMASHGLLDACTNGGPGVMFFWPLDSTRYLLPWRPVLVSPLGRGFFSEWGLRTLASEARWIWLPVGVVGGLVWWWRRGRGLSPTASRAATSRDR